MTILNANAPPLTTARMFTVISVRELTHGRLDGVSQVTHNCLAVATICQPILNL